MENKEIFIKRLKSFAWRLGAMVSAAALAFLADNLDILKLDPAVTVVVGLVLGEISKALNSQK